MPRSNSTAIFVPTFGLLTSGSTPSFANDCESGSGCKLGDFCWLVYLGPFCLCFSSEFGFSINFFGILNDFLMFLENGICDTREEFGNLVRNSDFWTNLKSLWFTVFLQIVPKSTIWQLWARRNSRSLVLSKHFMLALSISRIIFACLLGLHSSRRVSSWWNGFWTCWSSVAAINRSC